MKEIIFLMALTLSIGGVECNQLLYNEVSVLDTVKRDNEKLEFTARYIRATGISGYEEYPVVSLVTSKKDLIRYYDENKETKFSEEHKENPLYNEALMSVAEVCSRYNDDYFKNKDLIIAVIRETSGSYTHQIKSIERNANNEYEVNIAHFAPGIVTDDMAEWHFFIEIPKNKIMSKEQIKINIFSE